MKFALLPLFAFVAGCTGIPPANPIDRPRVDYHQHLVSPAFAPLVKLPPRDGAALLDEMDHAGVRQAVVLSVGYSFADERKALSDPDGRTRAENDWTAAQIAAAGGRLIGFCSANPLRDAALAEIDRCLRLRGMRGIKLHFGNSGVSLRKAEHVERIRHLLAYAERRSVPVLIHMRARGGTDFGAPDARIFLDQLLPIARHIPIILAHLGASSPGYPDQNDAVMAVFADAAARHDPRIVHLFFDVAANVTADATPEDGALIARRIRAIGVHRILYGSDLVPPGGSIASGWAIFREKVPLSPAEFSVIAHRRLAFTR